MVTIESNAVFRPAISIKAHALFRKILYNKTHSSFTHTFLPGRPETVYSFRTRSHNKSLTDYVKPCRDLNDHNFVIRAIYNKYTVASYY